MKQINRDSNANYIATLAMLLILLSVLPLFFLNFTYNLAGPLPYLFNFAHFAYFALLTLFLSRMPWLKSLPVIVQLVLILGAVFTIGIAVELIQKHIGRTASWRDIRINMHGAVFALLFLAPLRSRIFKPLRWAGQAGILVLVFNLFYEPALNLWDMNMARKQFPVLSNFETRFEAKRWTSGVIDQSISRDGNASLRVDLETTRFSGTTLFRGFGDWTGYSALEFSIYNPGQDVFIMNISIRDRQHDLHGGGNFHDRFNRRFHVYSGWNEVRIPIKRIEESPATRSLDLNSLTHFILFAMNLPEPRTIYLDYVRLVSGDSFWESDASDP